MKDLPISIILLEMKDKKGSLKAYLVLSLLFVILAGQFTIGEAQSSAVLSIEPPSIEVPLGNRVQLELEVDNGVDVHAFDLMINYDLERLSLVDWEHGDYLSDLTCTHLIRQPGVFELACNQLTQEEVDGDGVLLVMVFETLGLGFPDVTITEATFFDNTGVITYPQRQNGVVEVTSDPTFTSTATITRTPTQTLTPTSTISPSPSPSPTSTPTITPFLSPTLELTPTETLDLEAQETELPDQGTTAALQTAFALTETASSAGILSDTARTGEAGTPSPETSGEEDDSIDGGPSQSQNLVKELWRMTLWGVLIFTFLTALGAVICYFGKRRKKGDEEDLLL